MTQKTALSVQSLACHGKCSLTQALPLISACGVSLSVLPTVVLSTHTKGFGTPVKQDMTEFLFNALEHFKNENIIFDGVYTGYFSSKKQIDLFTQKADSLLKENAVFLVDPVLGDNGEFFRGINGDFVESYLKLCQKADIITPNLTEGYMLCGDSYREITTPQEVMDLTVKLYNLTKARIVLTGIEIEGKIGSAVYDGDEFILIVSKKHPQSFHGTGDMLSSLIFGLLLSGKSLFSATERAQDLVYEALKETKAEERNGISFEAIMKIKN